MKTLERRHERSTLSVGTMKPAPDVLILAQCPKRCDGVNTPSRFGFVPHPNLRAMRYDVPLTYGVAQEGSVPL